MIFFYWNESSGDRWKSHRSQSCDYNKPVFCVPLCVVPRLFASDSIPANYIDLVEKPVKQDQPVLFILKTLLS